MGKQFFLIRCDRVIPVHHSFSILHHCALHGYADVLKDVIDLGGSVSLMDNKGYHPITLVFYVVVTPLQE